MGIYKLARRVAPPAICALLLWSCQSQERIPGDRLTPGDAGRPTNAAGATNLADNMILEHTPQHSFFIDPFEQSRLGPGAGDVDSSPETGDYFAVRNQVPLVNLTPARAAEICASTGKRLCSRYEWTNACLGTHRRQYAYSNRFQSGYCRTKPESGGMAMTGAHGACRTDTGIYDMVGNVMEWVADSRGQMAIAVGGSYLTGDRADCFTNFFFPAEHQHRQIGFRCCRDVPKN